jgi:hypothetical protein
MFAIDLFAGLGGFSIGLLPVSILIELLLFFLVEE